MSLIRRLYFFLGLWSSFRGSLYKLRISGRVFAVSFFLVLAGITIASIVSSLVFIGAMRDEMDNVVHTAVDGIDQEIDSTIERMMTFGAVFEEMDELGSLIENRDTDTLNRMMLRYLKISGFDTITITDANGVVLSRPHQPDVIGDNASERGYVGPVLNGQAVLTIERGTTIDLGLFYGVPVIGGSEVAGALVVGVNLGKPSLLRKLASMYRAELSLYYGDTIVSSTLFKNGVSTVNRKADSAMTDAVLERGISRYGELKLADGRTLRVMNKPFIFNFNSNSNFNFNKQANNKQANNRQAIGMLSAGVSKLPIDHAIAVSVIRVAITGSVFVVIALWLSWLFARSISKLSAEKTKQEIFLERLMHNSPDAILVFDAEGRFIDCTDAFMRQAEIAGFDRIRGRRFSEVLGDLLGASQTAELTEIFARSIAEGRNMSPDDTINFGSGNAYRSYTVRFTPMIGADGGVIGCVALFHDMTDYLQARRAEKASQAKSAFLANISHEIRTPLNAVIGLSEIELQNSLPAGTHDNMETIYKSGSTLLGIINDILDISKIESGKFEIEPAAYNFPNLISDTIHLNVVRIASKPILFEPQISEDIPVELLGDEIRIKQILNNILSNAFKYTFRGKVGLKATCERHGDFVWMEYVVDDTGIGIKEKDIENIFVEYKQFDTRANRKIEGTGLGLSICKNLVALMDGSIDVESEYGKGSVFTVRIRQGIVNPEPIGIETAQNLKTFRLKDSRIVKTLSRTKMPYGKVLVVDDVVTNLDVAKGLMTPYGLTIHTASSGRRAVKMVREEKVLYDAIFMDHMMPEMDGIETVRVIREEIGTEYAKNVPIIALTANALVGNEKMFMENGFQGYISKPIDVVKLDALLNKWISGRHPETAGQETDTAPKCGADDFNGSNGFDNGPNNGLNNGFNNGFNNGPQPPLEDSQLEGSQLKDLQLENLQLKDLQLKDLQVDGLDISSGISRFGEKGLYLDVLRSFATNTPALLDNVRLMDEGSPSEYAIVVHGIKGACAGISADAARCAAQELEFAAKAGDIDTVRAKNGPFVQIIEKLIADIFAMFERIGFSRRTGSRTGNRERRAAPDDILLRKLLERCGHYDTAGMEEALSEIERYEYESGNDLVEWLRKKLDDLEYDQIRARLEKSS
ncbi:MAG: response regulator [Synergistaceae bacterium]|nr:response regulator [Synergistaceae bacterium]